MNKNKMFSLKIPAIRLLTTSTVVLCFCYSILVHVYAKHPSTLAQTKYDNTYWACLTINYFLPDHLLI